MSALQSQAEQIGYVLGILISAFIILAVPAFFIVSFALAIRRKSRLWTGLAIASGFLCLIPLGLFSYGLYVGITRARSHVAPDQNIAENREVLSDDGLCALTIPPHWKLLDNLHEEASLQAGHLRDEEYLIILTDLKEDFVGTLEQHAAITSESMLDVLESGRRSDPETLRINGYPAIRYEIRGVSDLTNIVYVQTTLEGDLGFYQVLGWTLASKIGTARDVIEEAVGSFREVKDQQSEPESTDRIGGDS